jgi:hypothetical protein
LSFANQKSLYGNIGNTKENNGNIKGNIGNTKGNNGNTKEYYGNNRKFWKYWTHPANKVIAPVITSKYEEIEKIFPNKEMVSHNFGQSVTPRVLKFTQAS